MLLFTDIPAQILIQAVRDVPGKGKLTQEFGFVLLCYREKCPTLHSASFFKSCNVHQSFVFAVFVLNWVL